MDGLPKVVEGIACLELALRNEEWLDRAPHLGACPRDFGKEKPSVCDIDVVAPGAELHRQKLPWRQGPYDKSWRLKEDLAREQPMEIPLGAIVQPILGQVVGRGHTPGSFPDGRGTRGAEGDCINISRRLPCVVEKDQGGTTRDHELLPGRRPKHS